MAAQLADQSPDRSPPEYRGRAETKVSSDSLHEESTRLPGRHIQIKSATLQVFAVPIIAGRVELILQAPFVAGQVAPRQADMALTLIRRIIDGNDEPFVTGSLPSGGDKAVVCPVAFPARLAFEKLPLTVAHGRAAEHI